MGKCNLDHTLEDVQKKFESQKSFLPEEIAGLFEVFFQKEHTQEQLNEVFHLLKKYDLASEEERKARNKKLLDMLKNI
jgi:citrate synthase